eukprot:scaffold30988_cov73-Skeletonema_marinoi.AAC.1
MKPIKGCCWAILSQKKEMKAVESMELSDAMISTRLGYKRFAHLSGMEPMKTYVTWPVRRIVRCLDIT